METPFPQHIHNVMANLPTLDAAMLIEASTASWIGRCHCKKLGHDATLLPFQEVLYPRNWWWYLLRTTDRPDVFASIVNGG